MHFGITLTLTLSIPRLRLFIYFIYFYIYKYTYKKKLAYLKPMLIEVNFRKVKNKLLSKK